MTGFGKRFLIMIASVVTIMDFLALYAISEYPSIVTPLSTFAIIIATVIPIAVNLWYWLPKYKIKW